ncbi:MAG: helix-turn-helix transcriptional regulator [Planctomycetaceae bacterium]
MSAVMTTRPAVESPATLLDVKQVAALLSCSARHVYRMSDAGAMPRPRHVGALVRWCRSEIEQWVAAGCPKVRQVGRAG